VAPLLARAEKAEAERDRLREALTELAVTFASRPDIQRLCGPKEIANYERARRAIAAAPEAEEGDRG
jgi:hypothetical protein